MSNLSSWWVYVICEEGGEEDGPCKVGTARNVSYRLSSLKNGNWRPLKVMFQHDAGSRRAAIRFEATALAILADYRIGVRDWVTYPTAKVVDLMYRVTAGVYD